MDEKERLDGLRYAKFFNYTDAQYEEALKITGTSNDLCKLLKALMDVSSRTSYTNNNTATEGSALVDSKNKSVCPASQERDSSSSCYSSITSFPSSSDQSLESIANQPIKNLRKIFIDGSNIARSHSNDASFSWLGIKLCVDWFRSRQHYVKAFVPQDKCQLADETIFSYLRHIDALVRTPTGCNDDMFIIEAARQSNAVIVSNDLFRDEKRFNDELERFIHLNRLPYVFVGDLFIPANDPRGRSGPKLQDFLSADFVEHGYVQHHKRLLCSTKSHQRYQRKKEYSSNQQYNTNQRNPIHSTRSLPIEQDRAIVADSNHQPTTCANQQRPPRYQKFNPGMEHDTRGVRRTTSVVYPNPDAKGSDVQSMIGLGKTALCRTKSHNL